jgi:hypothetical protein
MFAFNPNDRTPYTRSNFRLPFNRPAELLCRYFDQHPQASREEFLPGALWRQVRLRQQWVRSNGAGLARRESQETNRWPTARPPLSVEDIRIHASLIERLAVLHHERHGLWPKLRRFLSGNRLVRWLGLGPSRTGNRC